MVGRLRHRIRFLNISGMTFRIQILLLLTAGFFFTGSSLLKGQGDQGAPANKIIYWEALGIGGYQSLNYERMVFRAFENHVLGSFGVGASCLSSHKPREPEFRFYLLQRANLAFGYRAWYLETGLDLVLDRGRSYSYLLDKWRSWTSDFFLMYHFGVRYQKRSAGPFFRAYLFPIKGGGWNQYFLSNLGNEPEFEWKTYWWGGVAAGYTF